MYADNLTDSMRQAIDETERRRGIQAAYNKTHKITPKPIIKSSDNSILQFLDISRKLNAQEITTVTAQVEEIPLDRLPELISQLESQMHQAAKDLDFETAAQLRDRIALLRSKLVGKG
jgi:excinuclease ABC subunit B